MLMDPVETPPHTLIGWRFALAVSQEFYHLFNPAFINIPRPMTAGLRL